MDPEASAKQKVRRRGEKGKKQQSENRTLDSRPEMLAILGDTEDGSQARCALSLWTGRPPGMTAGLCTGKSARSQGL